MKNFYSLSWTCLLSAALVSAANASTITGSVFCDADQNQIIDSGDATISGVSVIVTNQNGTFSNSVVTAGDGSFSIHIPDFSASKETQDPLSQIYVETLDPNTLGAGSTIIIPTPITEITATPAFFISFASNRTDLVYTSGTGDSSNGDWLIDNPDCQSGAAPLTCTLKGNGAVHVDSSKKADSFQGKIATKGSKWMHVSRNLMLQFKTTQIETSSCSDIVASSDGTNAPTTSGVEIDFTGTGVLKGTGNNKTNYGEVLFTARAEDHGKKGKNSDRYYLRVYTSDGTTLLLVSGG